MRFFSGDCSRHPPHGKQLPQREFAVCSGSGSEAKWGVIRIFDRAACLLACGLVAACAGDKSETTTTTTTRSSGDPLLEKYAGNFRYEKSEDGSQRVVSNARSSFEGRQTNSFSGEYGTKQYGGTKAYTKKPWWGSKDYGRKAYEGPTDGSRYRKDSAWGGQQAPEGGETASDAGKSYRTGNYRTGAAREASARRIDKQADALTENRREMQGAPKIVGWEEQRKLQLSDTKGMLGKE
jgi:hypothetical protein